MTITPVQRETEKNDSIDDDRIQYGLRCSDVAYIIIDGGTCLVREIVSHTSPYHSSPCVQFKQLDGELIRAGMSILLRARPDQRRQRWRLLKQLFSKVIGYYMRPSSNVVSCGEQMEQIDIKIIKNKLFYNGYVMIKNKQRENVFYWECEKRSHKNEKNDFDYCNARMVTLLTNGKHVIREQEEKLLPPEPSSVEEINIPDNFKKCLNGDQFLLKEISISNQKILIFSAKNEIKNLIEAPYWIMDGTFKTVPNIFLRFEQCYEQLFEGLISICDDYGCELLPKCIINDFEKAAINAVSNIFPESFWRKIQSSGLATHYGNDIEFALKLRCAEHVGIYRLIIKMRKEQQNTLGQIKLIVSGNQRPKPKLTSIKRQLQIQNVIEDKISCEEHILDVVEALVHPIKQKTRSSNNLILDKLSVKMSKRGMLFKLDSSNYENFLLLLVLWTVITLEFRHSTPTKEDDLEIGKDRDQIFTAILLLVLDSTIFFNRMIRAQIENYEVGNCFL
ncbi:hypothetical protein QTP88_011605 [Uroleucon formosanum]